MKLRNSRPVTLFKAFSNTSDASRFLPNLSKLHAPRRVPTFALTVSTWLSIPRVHLVNRFDTTLHRISLLSRSILSRPTRQKKNIYKFVKQSCDYLSKRVRKKKYFLENENSRQFVGVVTRRRVKTIGSFPVGVRWIIGPILSGIRSGCYARTSLEASAEAPVRTRPRLRLP